MTTILGPMNALQEIEVCRFKLIESGATPTTLRITRTKWKEVAKLLDAVTLESVNDEALTKGEAWLFGMKVQIIADFQVIGERE